MLSPIVIPSSPEQTPTHATRCALSVIVLSSDEETVSPIKSTRILPKQLVSAESSSDDDLILVNILKHRYERAEILNEPEGDTIQAMTPWIERSNDNSNNSDNIFNTDTATCKIDEKKLEKLKAKQAKELLKETQRNMKKVNIKRDKNTTAKEMIVEISTDLIDRDGEELVAMLQEIEVECVYTANPVPCSILLKRKVDLILLRPRLIEHGMQIMNAGRHVKCFWKESLLLFYNWTDLNLQMLLNKGLIITIKESSLIFHVTKLFT